MLGRRQLISLLMMLGLSLACGTGQKEVEGIPIVVSREGSQAVDIDLVIASAEKEVEKILPGAYLTFISLAAKCEALSELQGRFHLDFSQTRLTLFGERVYTARVEVNTIDQNLRMRVQDETEQYLSTEKLELTGISILEIATALENYLSSVGECNDTIVLARVSTGNPWSVRCGPPDQVFINCIEIDPKTAEIAVLR